uniref:Uncharacterized protein LOC116947095 n=1 Tax=Petromyzon marinus TaxID=7757 RepID=A0AAJ7X1U3_PETMA|nr:uncharacterized protein LOC116947095 [Petromyzon marinus]
MASEKRHLIGHEEELNAEMHKLARWTPTGAGASPPVAAPSAGGSSEPLPRSTALSVSTTMSAANVIRKTGGAGGSQQNVVQRNVRPSCDRGAKAAARAEAKLGAAAIVKIRQDWDAMETGRAGSEWQQSEGIILNLVQMQLSEREIRTILPVGGSRLARLRKVAADGFDSLHTRRAPTTPAHALTDADLTALRNDVASWEVEDGFACGHLLDSTITWTKLHSRYKAKMEEQDARVISFSRWTRYVHQLYAGLRLARSAEDVCDCCVRIGIALASDDIADDERERLGAELEMHLHDATAQPSSSRTLSTAPSTTTIERPTGPLTATAAPAGRRFKSKLRIFGGSFSMPHYGHERPSPDYFNSNPMMQNFITADVTRGIDHVVLYEERAQDKEAEAMCSLRFQYHHNLLIKRGAAMPQTLLVVLHNCVGQNKSHIVMQFFATLSILFYRKVVLVELLPGHSHNEADRVVAWCRNKMKGKSFFTP